MVRMLRLLLLSALLALTLALAPLHHAGATLSTCAGCISFDPVATLADGTRIRAWVEVQDTASDVQSISYTLHVPSGSSVRDVGYVGAVPQTMQVVADAPPGLYWTSTTVSTQQSWVPVVSHLSLIGHTGQGRTDASVPGFSNLPVFTFVHLTGPNHP